MPIYTNESNDDVDDFSRLDDVCNDMDSVVDRTTEREKDKFNERLA